MIGTTKPLGDILSDQISGLVGGLGLAPGANIGAKAAISRRCTDGARTLPTGRRQPWRPLARGMHDARSSRRSRARDAHPGRDVRDNTGGKDAHGGSRWHRQHRCLCQRDHREVAMTRVLHVSDLAFRKPAVPSRSRRSRPAFKSEVQRRRHLGRSLTAARSASSSAPAFIRHAQQVSRPSSCRKPRFEVVARPARDRRSPPDVRELHEVH